ncbi:MAG: hypothetical protein GX804_07745 [Lentisphaerae bacterium]|jgi:TolB protein|nr:hypothetical protein [Lentisphaerota bacterium]
MPRFFSLFVLSLFLTSANLFSADIRISGEGKTDGKQTISLAGIRSDRSPLSQEFLDVLKNDLVRSGWFIPVSAENASVVLTGSVDSSSLNVSASVETRWLANMRRFTWSKASSTSQVRDAAHALCDQIVQRVVGKPSMASSKILFVGKRNGAETEIYVCDADGARMQQLTNDRKLCMSPNWIPGKNAFLYTSWLTGSAAVYRVDLDTKEREVISSQPGVNHGAVESSKGYTALILSRSGGVDLYVQYGKKLNRVTHSRDVNESSPAWSPDGDNLVYVSDEGRIPRLYKMNVSDKQGRRLTYSSVVRECFAPEWGPFDQITFCGRAGGRYGIYIIDAKADPRVSTPKLVSPPDGADYEDPSWAPDGRHIVCTRTVNYRRSLVILDILGDPPITLHNLPGEWYLPNWGR